jgi:WD40 repeat protein
MEMEYAQLSLSSLISPNQYLSCLASHSETIVTGDTSGFLHCIDPTTLAPKAKFLAHINEQVFQIYTHVSAPQIVISCSGEGFQSGACVWDLRNTNQPVMRAKGEVMSVAGNISGNQIATGGDEVARIFDIRTHKQLRSFKVFFFLTTSLNQMYAAHDTVMI